MKDRMMHVIYYQGNTNKASILAVCVVENERNGHYFLCFSCMYLSTLILSTCIQACRVHKSLTEVFCADMQTHNSSVTHKDLVQHRCKNEG